MGSRRVNEWECCYSAHDRRDPCNNDPTVRKAAQVIQEGPSEPTHPLPDELPFSVPATPSPGAGREAALEAITRAERAVDDLCQGRLRWEMRVPAEPDHDPDLVISEALRLARAALGAGSTRGEPDLPKRSRDAIVALGDLLIREHGESCDCDTCLVVQPLVDAALADQP